MDTEKTYINATFYNPNIPGDKNTVNVSDYSVEEMYRLANCQRLQGRCEIDLDMGYPATCPACGVVTKLTAFPGDSIVCDRCLKKIC